MTIENYKSIKILSAVKERMDTVKRKYSYSEYIEMMLQYFAITGMNPEKATIMPGAELKKDVDRIISIQKAQEKIYFKEVLNLLKNINSQLQPGKIENLFLSPDSINNDPDNPLTYDDFRKLADAYEGVESTLKKTEKVNKSLQESNERLSRQLKEQSVFKSGSLIDIEIINESLEHLLSNAKKVDSRRGLVQLDESVLIACIDRIKSELK